MPLTLRMDPGVSPPQGEPSNDEQTVTRVATPSSSESGGAVSERRSRSKPPLARRCPSCQQAFSGEARFCPFDGDLLDEAPDYNPSSDPLIGQILDGRYEVTAVIGEGGMGTVYEVRHVALGRRFALKVLRRDIADAEHTARFIQEAKAAAAIGHPNIVAVTDFGEVQPDGATGSKVPYFVMEYLTGISLAALLRSEKTLTPQRAAPILQQCAAGLAAAHAAGVIHRDLKPDNVFLCRSGDREYVKLLDFGVAKMAGVGRLTRAGMVFGTPHYMSPEQAAGQPVDQRADVYALGVILYECLAGKVPFEADTYMGVLTKHMFATPEPIEHVVPDARHLGALGPIAMRCLAKNPQERYASMAELASAIEMAMSDPGRAAAEALSDRPAGALRLREVDRIEGPIDPPAPPRRSLVGPIGIGIGVVALCLGAFLGFRAMSGHREAAGPAPSANVAPPAPTDTTPPTTAPTPSATSPEPSNTEAPPVASAKEVIKKPESAIPTTRPSATTPRSTDSARPVNSGKTQRHGGGDVVDPWGP